MDRNPQVLVVGAGLAGLVAAHRLAEAGVAVRVLEAAESVGGRMTTETVDGFVVDRGAQFLSSAYFHLPRLVDELGLQGAWRPTSPRAAIVRDGEIRRVNYRNPLSLAAGGPLNARELVDLGRHYAALRKQVRGRSVADYGAWSDLDDMNAGEWLAGEAVPAVADYVYEPMLQAFYFQPLAGTSRALAMAVAAFGLHRPRTMTVEGGIGRIPDTLAAGLDVRLGSPVLRLEIDSHGVSVDTPSGALEADHVIVAAPAPVARDLLSDAATEAEEALLACTYSGTINVCLGLRAGFRLPSALRDVYGVLIPARERLNVAAISVERNKCPDRARHGELLEAFLSGDASERLVGTSDEEILAVVLDELERYLPAISGAVITTHLIRWPVAEPRSPVGRASAVATYRRTPRSDRRVLLAGDYVAFPWTDGAAEAGTWAAAQLLSHAVPPIRPRPTR